MLKYLKVKNFAIIEDLSVSFQEGLTVLTGETGAGKSLIIDTISLLLGQRADTDMIRHGETKASIEGCFTYEDLKIEALLERFSLPLMNHEITITRELYDTSKNIIKVNGVVVSLMMLKQIASLVADIHVQNDTYKLFNQDTYLEFICPKNDSQYDAFFSKYTVSLSRYLESYKLYETVVKGQKESLERLEFLEFEKREIEELNLSIGIDVELEQSVSKLENYDKLFNALQAAHSHLSNEFFSIDEIYSASTELSKIVSLDEEYGKNQEKLLDCYYILEDIQSDLSKQINSLDFDENQLNYQLEQLNEINRIKKKYNMSVEELLEYYDKITLEIDMANNYDEVLKEKKQMLEKNYLEIKKSAQELSAYRKRIAVNIEKRILQECLDLDLEDTDFEIRVLSAKLEDPFNKTVFKETGIDEIDFLISFNKGEPRRPLAKVASGGEMSRVMIAFKSYFSSLSKYSLMVFDEIDTGVSGATAKKIALKLWKIAQHQQVLCITHLPQVAAIGDNHIHIYKTVEQDRTTTHIKDLSFDERVEEVAMMLSGDKLSMYALEHAKALLKEKKEPNTVLTK